MQAVAARVYASGGAVPTRAELKDQISALEAQLSTLPVPEPPARMRTPRPRVLTTEELAEVRDELAARLEQIDAMRDDLVDMLASIRTAMGEELTPASAQTKARAVARPATANS